MEVAVIKNRELEKDFEEALEEQDYRIYVIYLFLSRTGFRISDILPLRVRDVKGTHLGIYERKGKKYREVFMPAELRRVVARLTKGKKDREFLFKSPRGHKPLDYTTVYKIMKSVGKEIGIFNVGTHTGRKTYGHRIWKKTGSLGDVQNLLGHANISDTRRYIGADKEYKDDIIKSVFD